MSTYHVLSVGIVYQLRRNGVVSVFAHHPHGGLLNGIVERQALIRHDLGGARLHIVGEMPVVRIGLDLFVVLVDRRLARVIARLLI